METKGSITPLNIPQRLMLVIVGLLFIAAGIYIYADIFNFGKGVNTTKGTIVGLQKDENIRRSGSISHKSVTYRPVVEFTVGAKQYKFLASVASDSYKVDQRVRINYDPKNPSRSPRLAGKKELLWPAVGVLCGGIAILLGIFAPSKKPMSFT